VRYSRILERAWEITWRYKALWVFGILVALLSGEGSGGGSGGRAPNVQLGNIGRQPWREFFLPLYRPEVVIGAITIALAILFLIVVFGIISMVARYVSHVALIKMVNEYEETGEQLSVGQGFRLGWSYSALRLFLIDLLVAVPVVLVFIVLFVLSLSPLLLWATGSDEAGVVGTIATVGLVLLLVLLAIVVGVALSLLKKFFYRIAVLEDAGVFDSIREGWQLVRRQLRHAGGMWLIMTGVTIAYVIALVPVAIGLVLLGLLLGGGSGLAVGWLVNLPAGGVLPWLAGAAVGIPVFLLFVIVPLTVVGGVFEVFRSTTWTLTYRELLALERAEQ